MAGGVTVTAVRQLKPIDVWREMDGLVKREMDSQMFWHSISEDQQLAIQLVIKDALLGLIEHPERWVPASIDPANGDRLDITISVQLPEIEARALAERVNTERLHRQTAAELLELEKKLRA